MPTNGQNCCSGIVRPFFHSPFSSPKPNYAGKAEFDGQLVDVIAEGMPIDRGQTVIVTTARGSRVLVRVAEIA